MAAGLRLGYFDITQCRLDRTTTPRPSQWHGDDGDPAFGRSDTLLPAEGPPRLAQEGEPPPVNELGGGRTWWAQFEFTRINIDVITTSTSDPIRVDCAASTSQRSG